MPTKVITCLSEHLITNGGGSIVENNYGTVSVFINPTQPYHLTKECCEFLSPNYYFDIINQKCRWATPLDCTKNNNINVVLNPKGNDGTIFTLEENDNCFLEIKFDYLLQFSCNELALVGVSVLPETTGSSSTSTERLSNQTTSFENSEEITNIDCDYLVNQLVVLNSNLENTPYSVEYNDLFYCFTENGLDNWSIILGSINYNNFLNGDLTTYTNANIQQLISNETIVGEFLYECNVDPTTISILKTQISELEKQILECQNIITNSNKTIVGGSEEVINPEFFSCVNSVSALESLDLAFSIDIYDDLTNKLTSVYELPLFGIGDGNLFNYLQHSTNSGILICGDSGCTSSFILNDTSLTGFCNNLSVQIMNGLIAEAANSGLTLNYATLFNYISASSLNSNWISYTTTITDPDLLVLFANKKIKLNFKLKNTCLNVCLLLDNIKLNRICETVESNSLIISKNPSFELTKTIDNKKSWISSATTHTRNFELTLRETNYNINDYRLAINTKEIDLNVSPSSAIENDVWCYINDNSCILTGNCAEIATTCGDDCIDLNNLLTTPLTGITTIEEFNNILYTELIDVKSRKTLSGYPTLRLLYDRYLNSSLYCGTNSSAFNYLSIDRFAGLIGTYWVDLIEQVVPSTTIWGSTYVYKNTLFDTQKFKYKTHNTYFCEYPTVFPFSGIGSATTVQVIQTTISIDSSGNTVYSPFQTCNGTYIMRRDCGSEFLGKVTIIGKLIGEETEIVVV